MPYAAPHPCTHPGCPELTNSGPCEEHKRRIRHEYENRRGSAASVVMEADGVKQESTSFMSIPSALSAGLPCLPTKWTIGSRTRAT